MTLDIQQKDFWPDNKQNSWSMEKWITGGPLYVIVEYCQHGNLRDFLRAHDSRNEGYERPNSERLVISERTLVSFSRQVRWYLMFYNCNYFYVMYFDYHFSYTFGKNIFSAIKP